MPFSRLAESRIREALERGEFDNLPHAGQPLDLDEYFSAPPELRMAYSILKNAKVAPAEVDLINEVARLREQVAAATDPAQQQELRKQLRTREIHLSMLLERRKRGEK